jgi:hypothetical protein
VPEVASQRVASLSSFPRDLVKAIFTKPAARVWTVLASMKKTSVNLEQN